MGMSTLPPPLKILRRRKNRKEPTFRFVICDRLIILPTQLCPFRKLVLRARRIHLTPQPQDLAAQLRLRTGDG